MNLLFTDRKAIVKSAYHLADIGTIFKTTEFLDEESTDH